MGGAAARLADPFDVELAGEVAGEARVGVEAGVGVAFGGDVLEGRQVIGAEGADVGREGCARGRVSQRDTGLDEIVAVAGGGQSGLRVVVGEEVEAADLIGATPSVNGRCERVRESGRADAGDGEAEERGVPGEEFTGVELLGCGWQGCIRCTHCRRLATLVYGTLADGPGAV